MTRNDDLRAREGADRATLSEQWEREELRDESSLIEKLDGIIDAYYKDSDDYKEIREALFRLEGLDK